MARIYARLNYADTRAELADYKNARRGAVEDAFWDEDELIDYRRSAGKKKKPVRRGCEGNDGKQHVWVWVTVGNYYYWSNRTSLHEIKVCCGCSKMSHGRKSSRNWRIVNGRVKGLSSWLEYL